MERGGLTRRDFIKLTAAVVGGLLIPGCNPFSEPTPAAVPTIAPSRLRLLEKKDLESFTSKIGEVFRTAYKANPTNVWDSSTLSLRNKVNESLNSSFAKLSADPQDATNPLPALIHATAAELMQQPINLGKKPRQDEKWIAYIRAIREIYTANGFTVESGVYTFPPTLAIYRESKDQTYETNPFGLIDTQKRPQNLKVVYHLIESDQADAILDTFRFLGWIRSSAESYAFEEGEIFVHKQQTDINIEVLKKVGSGQPFPAERLNPPTNDKGAIALRQEAAKVIATITGLDKAYYDGLKVHEETHLLQKVKLLRNQREDEERSYVAQLFAQDEKIARLSLASFLFNITTKEALDELKRLGDYSANYNLAGMQAAVADAVEAIYYIPEIENKLGSFKGSKMGPSNRFLPKSPFSSEYTFHTLSNISKLTGADINKIARYVIYKHKSIWLPEDTFPATV